MTQLLTKIIADFSTTLTTKTTVGATTATLTSGLDGDGIQLPTATYGFTIDRNNANKEYFTATLTGANLTDIKTVTRGTGVGTSGLVKTHRKGAEVIITDWVSLKRVVNLLDGTTSFDSATPLGYDGTATISTANQFATKAYADALAIAGSPDSTTTTKGIGKVSVAPVSSTSPIFVGDNDPRVPTQSENDAMQGTNGSPSGSNRYVTDSDTSATPADGRVARYNADGDLILSRFIRNFILGENVTLGDALCIFPENYVNVDTTASGTGTGSSISIAANSNRGLLVFCAPDAGGTPTLTYNGVSMTSVNGGANGVWAFYLVAPATGSNSLVISVSSAWTAYSVYNAAQTQPESNITSTNPSGAFNSATSIATGARVFTAFGTGQDGVSGTFTGNGFFTNNLTPSNTYALCTSGDSGFLGAAETVTCNASTGYGGRVVGVSIAPATALVYNKAYKTSASTGTLSRLYNKYNTFIGFANATGTSGNAIAVTMAGVMTGLSGLTGGLTYYLANTAGAIASSAGSNSKKIGQSISATELNVIQSI